MSIGRAALPATSFAGSVGVRKKITNVTTVTPMSMTKAQRILRMMYRITAWLLYRRGARRRPSLRLLLEALRCQVLHAVDRHEDVARRIHPRRQEVGEGRMVEVRVRGVVPRDGDVELAVRLVAGIPGQRRCLLQILVDSR